MPLIVHGKKGFLHQVLHLVRQPGKPFAQEGAQMRPQVPQKDVIRGGVARDCAHEQSPQALFARVYVILR